MEEIKVFFNSLSERCHNENCLSDITYALCNASKTFRQFFLNFFFGQNTLTADDIEISREISFTDLNSRPDFIIKNKNKNELYLVENKISDCKHHFSQYLEILKRYNSNSIENHLGYIANYKIHKESLSSEDQEAFKLEFDNNSGPKTWKMFYDTLKNDHECLKDELVLGYLEYLEKVCSIDDFPVDPSMQLDQNDFKCVHNFYQNILDSLNSFPKEELVIYDTPKSFCTKCYAGKYFEVKNFSGNQSVWGWIGISYTKNGGIISIEFENKEGWGEPVCNLPQWKNKLIDGWLRFYLTENNYSKETIIAFLGKVLNTIKTNTENNSLWHFQDEAAKFSEFLVLKKLPILLEEHCFSTQDKTEKYYLSLDYGSDQEVMNQYIGRYFILKSAKTQENMLSIFIGVVYGNNQINFNGIQPRYVLQINKEQAQKMNLKTSDWNNDDQYWLTVNYPLEGKFNENIEKIKETLENLLSDQKQ